MTQPPPTRASAPVDPATAALRAEREDDAEHGVGWLVFAAIIIGMVGVLNVIYGIAAVSNSNFYAHGTEYILGSLETWGWIMLVIGVVQFAASWGILAFAQWARWAGIVSAATNGIVQLFVLPAAPFLALTLLTVDVLVVYGLITYGGRWRVAGRE